MKIWSVYVMAAPAPGGVTYFKIGRTSDLAKRLGGVQTGCPLPITKAWIITVWGNGASQSLEGMLLQKLSPYRTHGEWIRMDPTAAMDKAAMNDAFAMAVDFASVPAGPVKWREMSVAELRAAMRQYLAERTEERSGKRALAASVDRARMALRRRQTM